MTDPEEHPLEYLPELALGVMSEGDAAAVRAHLESCASCRAEYDEMARVASLLPLAAEDAVPGESTRAAVLERIAREPRLLRAPGAGRRPRWWLGAAAAAVLVAALAGTGGFLAADNDTSNMETERDRQAALLQSAAQGTMEMVQGENSGARLTFLLAPGHSEGFAWLDGLPALPAGKAYQAWFIRGASAEPANVFTVSQGGVWLEADARIADYNAIGLTIEDAGGATTPSQAPFVVVDLTKSARAR